MDGSTCWKNFKLGRELDISGRFIYNGLLCFHQMEHFCYEDEIFEFFYNISVGIERLLKICIILTEHSDDTDQEEFNKRLITHNHQELFKRVKDKHKIGVSKVHNEFIQIIAEFYKSHRYGRYDLSAWRKEDGEKIQLYNFIKKYLGITIDNTMLFNVTGNDANIKTFIGKTVGKIAEELFKIVKLEAHRLNIQTYKIRYDSKAFKIFIIKKYDFFDEDRLYKELLVYFVNSTEDSGQIKFMKGIKPLDFDPGQMAQYIKCPRSNEKMQTIMDELETLYEDMDKDTLSERKEIIDLVGNQNIDLYGEYDEDK